MSGQDILGIIFVVVVIISLVALLLYALWMGFISYYCEKKIKCKANKIQWRCEETTLSERTRVINKISQLQNAEECYTCKLYYRVLPSELSRFVRTFGTNEWKEPLPWQKFHNEEEFNKFASRIKTIQDLDDFVRDNHKIVWYHP